MTKEEAYKFLIDISYALGNMSIEYLTEKDGEKMREAIDVLKTPETVTEFADRCRECGKMKTGHWVDWDDGFSACECSECKDAEFIKSKYCPNCGIKMDNPLEVNKG